MASLRIGLSHFAMAAIPSGKNVTELSLTLITAPFALRKSVPVPEPESACGSLMAWYSAIVAQGVAPVVKYHLAVACLLEIIYAVGVP